MGRGRKSELVGNGLDRHVRFLQITAGCFYLFLQQPGVERNTEMLFEETAEGGFGHVELLCQFIQVDVDARIVVHHVIEGGAQVHFPRGFLVGHHPFIAGPLLAQDVDDVDDVAEIAQGVFVADPVDYFRKLGGGFVQVHAAVGTDLVKMLDLRSVRRVGQHQVEFLQIDFQRGAPVVSVFCFDVVGNERRDQQDFPGPDMDGVGSVDGDAYGIVLRQDQFDEVVIVRRRVLFAFLQEQDDFLPLVQLELHGNTRRTLAGAG